MRMYGIWHFVWECMILYESGNPDQPHPKPYPPLHLYLRIPIHIPMPPILPTSHPYCPFPFHPYHNKQRGSNHTLKKSSTGLESSSPPPLKQYLMKKNFSPKITKSFTSIVSCVPLWLSSLLNKKNPGPRNHTFEQREVYWSLYWCSKFQISEHAITVFNKGSAGENVWNQVSQWSYKRLILVKSFQKIHSQSNPSLK